VTWISWIIVELHVQIVLGHVERVLDMLDLWSRPVSSLEQNDIKPTGSIDQVVPRQILGRQADQFFLLLAVYSMHRSTEILRPSRLYLDEHQHRSIFGNQIQFTERGAEVLGNDPIALLT